MSKYEPFKKFLARRAETELPMSFEDVERTLGFTLPKSAREYPPWWSNDTGGGHVQARAWLDVGWRTAKVDIRRERVMFVRTDADPKPSSRGTPGADRNLVAVNLSALTPAGSKLLGDYAREANGDMAVALARAVHEAAIARRGRLVRQWVASAPRVPPGEPDSAALIREDRDAR